MKLVSFAVVSFLAATVSAGFSETLGNADYSVHQLEKRDPGEDMQKQLEEEIETRLGTLQGGSWNISGHEASRTDHCILCDQQLLSTSIAHLVVECEQVAGHRIQSGLVPAIQKSRLRLLGRALDPGVENVYTWLRGGVLNGEADLDHVGWTGLWSMNLWGRGMIIGRWQHG
ncbi:hypothetical protein BASA61_004998 [Batrachochytrium salamandrivorans]|nr:hypothetical protein BASA61_004998 [Batrachochytrium salamandrivorans]